jgi:hypothetical protein
MLQRWRAELLLYNFTIEHRPANMLTECDMLSRYNQDTEQWNAQPTDTQPTENKPKILAAQINPRATLFPIEATTINPTLRKTHKLPRPHISGNIYWPRSSQIQDLRIHCNILIDNALGLPIYEALTELYPTSMSSELNRFQHLTSITSKY